MALDLETLIVRLEADATDYLKKMREVETVTDSACKSVTAQITGLVTNAEKHLVRFPQLLEQNVTQSCQRAAAHVKKAVDDMISDRARLGEPLTTGSHVPVPVAPPSLPIPSVAGPAGSAGTPATRAFAPVAPIPSARELLGPEIAKVTADLERLATIATKASEQFKSGD